MPLMKPHEQAAVVVWQEICLWRMRTLLTTAFTLIFSIAATSYLLVQRPAWVVDILSNIPYPVVILFHMFMTSINHAILRGLECVLDDDLRLVHKTKARHIIFHLLNLLHVCTVPVPVYLCLLLHLIVIRPQGTTKLRVCRDMLLLFIVEHPFAAMIDTVVVLPTEHDFDESRHIPHLFMPVMIKKVGSVICQHLKMMVNGIWVVSFAELGMLFFELVGFVADGGSCVCWCVVLALVNERRGRECLGGGKRSYWHETATIELYSDEGGCIMMKDGRGQASNRHRDRQNATDLLDFSGELH